MSDEFENSEQNNNQDYMSLNPVEDVQSPESENKDETPAEQMNTEQDEVSSSAVDDPAIQASLKQLSISENENKTAIIHTPESVKNIIEAAILAAKKAISLDKLLTLFPEGEVVDKNILRQAIELLMQDYQNRGIELIEVSSGFRFQVTQMVAPWVARLWEEKPQKYSRALLETLALVAYRQPITRGEIEEIRGVSVSSQIMRTLVDREWVRVIGHRDVPGKPAMYATTKQFLDYFGLKKLDELPSLSEIRDLDAINAELDFGDGNENQIVDDNKANEVAELAEMDMEDISDDEQVPEQHIDIDIELAALKETYKQLDEIDSVEEMENKLQHQTIETTTKETKNKEDVSTQSENAEQVEDTTQVKDAKQVDGLESQLSKPLDDEQ